MRTKIQKLVNSARELGIKIRALQVKVELQRTKCKECQENGIVPDECKTEKIEEAVEEKLKEVNDLITEYNKQFSPLLIKLFYYLSNNEIPKIEPEIKRGQL